MATRIFSQQAVALGRLFTIASNFLDPDAYFIGGGVVEAAGAFKTWFLQKVRDSTTLREEEAAVAAFALVPKLDMAGARGAAMAALDAVLEA
jgi:predicted NBD/HSP70 family sugar kinase